MAEESQNALLKTLEEPASFAHLVLISSQPSALLGHGALALPGDRASPRSAPRRSRSGLAATHRGADPTELRAAARLAGGDLERAELLLAERGRELRARSEGLARAARAGELDDAPWQGLLDAAEKRGAEVGESIRDRLDALADQARDAADRRAEQRLRKEAAEAGKRASRRGRTDALDTGLALVGAWLRDLAAVADGASELVLAADRESELRDDAAGLDPRRARRGAELVMDTRRRLTVNVSEELALEALAFRLEFLLRARLSPWKPRTPPRRLISVSPMVGQPAWRRRRPFGVRLYLAFAFAGVALITAGLAYLLVSETGQEAADEQLDEIASGRTVLARGRGRRPRRRQGAQTALDVGTRTRLLGLGLRRRPASSSPTRISQGVPARRRGAR